MTSADGIRRLGFRRWYERQLIEGHAYLVTCVLSAVLVLACVEALDWRASFLRLIVLLAAVAAGLGLVLGSLRRYNAVLQRAEVLGGQSTCAECCTYGLLQVVDAAPASAGERAGVSGGGDNAWIRVRCRKCGHEWPMDNA